MLLATDGPMDAVLRPTNTIAIAGHEITLPCTSASSNESRWYFYGLNTTQPNTIYNGSRREADTDIRISVNFNSCSLKTCHLTIESVQLEDAGYYVCFEESSSARKAASLDVLGRNRCYYLRLLNSHVLQHLIF